MNTRQTSIKISILLMYFGHNEQRYETLQVVHKRTKQEGESQADEQASQIRII